MLIIGFNPRTRTGCDEKIRHGAITNDVSIHAPARGATIFCFIVYFIVG